jgi:hypothetical protein
MRTFLLAEVERCGQNREGGVANSRCADDNVRKLSSLGVVRGVNRCVVLDTKDAGRIVLGQTARGMDYEGIAVSAVLCVCVCVWMGIGI